MERDHCILLMQNHFRPMTPIHYSRKTSFENVGVKQCKCGSKMHCIYKICISAFALQRNSRIHHLSNMSQFKVYAFYSIYAPGTNSCHICFHIKPIVEEQQLSQIANLPRDNAVGKCLEIILMLDYYYYSSFPGDWAEKGQGSPLPLAINAGIMDEVAEKGKQSGEFSWWHLILKAQVLISALIRM